MKKQSKESLIEDALARLLAIAYKHAKDSRAANRIGNDEGLLRKALFGNDNDRSTK